MSGVRPFKNKGNGKLLTSETTALWEAQDRTCPICGEPLLPHMRYSNSDWAWSIEHVYPKHLKLYEHVGNKLVTHRGCNNAKGERMPTGCEITMLLAVNAKLGLELTPWRRAWVDDVPKISPLAWALMQAGLAPGSEP